MVVVTVMGTPGVITPLTSDVNPMVMLPALVPGSIPIVYVPSKGSVTEPTKFVLLKQLDEVNCAPPGAKMNKVHEEKVDPLSCRLTP